MGLENKKCPCGSGKYFSDCCGPFLEGDALPNTAEELMRSRYVAFHEKLPDYLARTSHFSLLSPDFIQSQATFMESHSWHGLKIEMKERGGAQDAEGIVQFAAQYLGPDGPGLHRERSYFIREEGKWLFLRGEEPPAAPPAKQKTGRNDPCPCGSGKKYKKCHGR